MGLSPMGEPRSRRELKESEIVFQDIVDTALKRFGSGLQKVLEDIHRWAPFAQWGSVLVCEECYLVEAMFFCGDLRLCFSVAVDFSSGVRSQQLTLPCMTGWIC